MAEIHASSATQSVAGEAQSHVWADPIFWCIGLMFASAEAGVILAMLMIRRSILHGSYNRKIRKVMVK